MLALTKEDIINAFSMKHAIKAVKLAFTLHSTGKSIVPLRTNINVPPMQGQTLIQDIITADAIYKKARSLGIGTEIKF